MAIDKERRITVITPDEDGEFTISDESSSKQAPEWIVLEAPKDELQYMDWDQLRHYSEFMRWIETQVMRPIATLLDTVRSPANYSLQPIPLRVRRSRDRARLN